MKFDGPILDKRWRLGPRMGSGAQALTYLARDERNPDRVVVLKQFRLKKGNWKRFDLFEREARVLERLRHPGIPRFVASFESEPGVFNLVMERSPGATLRAIATRVRFTDEELRDILARVLEILDYLHRRSPPVIHRDIKPANLVRDAKGQVTLVDFGGVRDAVREDGGSTVIGTFGYMAPEQLHGEATPATDIYSLGATVVALAGGVEPEKVPRRGLRMDLQSHLEGRDPALVATLEAMTDPDPEQRPRSARAVSEMLRRPHALPPGVGAPGAASGSGSAGPRRGSQALQKDTPRTPANWGEEVSDMLAAVPRPIEVVLRVLLVGFSIGGYVTVAMLQSVFLPLVFALVGAVGGAGAKPRIEATRGDILGALEEGKQGFRTLQQHSMGKKQPRLRE